MAKYTKFEQMSRVKQFYPKNPSLFCDITSNSQFESLFDFTEKNAKYQFSKQEKEMDLK